jgi:two-component system, OmpR family, sensor kinase
VNQDNLDNSSRFRLTNRQREIAMLIARGLSNRQIAAELVLTPGTVANHVAHMLARIGAESRAQIAAWAIEHGMSPTQDRLLTLLEQLLEIDTRTLSSALDPTATLLRHALEADHTYVFVYDAAVDSLVLRAASDSRSHAASLAALPIRDGGWIVETFVSGSVHRLPRDNMAADELRNVERDLGARSAVFVPLDIGETRRGVLGATSDKRDLFPERDVRFLMAVSRWVGVIAHRAELTEAAIGSAIEAARAAVTQELVVNLAEDLGRRTLPLARDVDLMRGRAQHIGRLRDRSATQRLAQDVRELQQLVNDLSDVADLERGQFHLNPQELDLVEAARSIVPPFRRTLLDVRVRARGTLSARVDARRFRQAVEHLVAEVHRRVPGQPVTVALETEIRDGTTWAVVTVAAPAPTAAHAESAAQVLGSGNEAIASGVGVRLARRIASAHGGSLTLHSASAEHVQFALQLPMADRTAVAAKRPDTMSRR